MKPIMSNNGAAVSTLSPAGREAGIPNNGRRHDAAFGRPLRRAPGGALARTKLTAGAEVPAFRRGASHILINSAMEALDEQRDAV
jgi:hypothetical protein